MPYSKKKVNNCLNIRDLRALARKNLPDAMFHYMDGAADDEITLARNTQAFNNYELMPNYLVDVEEVKLKTKILGQKLDLPFFLSPTGMNRLFHHEKELAVARVADSFGTLYSLSTVATSSIEEISSLISTPKLFQLYVHNDKGLNKDLVDNNYRKVEKWADKIGVKIINIKNDKFDSFFNINTKADLEDANKLLKEYKND